MNLFVTAFGRKTIYTPDDQVSERVRVEAVSHLRKRFAPGSYTNSTDVNAILQYQFQFYSDRAKRLIRKLASRDFMEFLLYQYELTVEVENATLVPERQATWMELGPILRRALKYLAEQTVLQSPPEATVMSPKRLIPCVQEVIGCAIEMVRIYIFSDATHSLFPDHTKAEIFPPEHSSLLSIEPTGVYRQAFANFSERVSRHLENQSKFSPELTIDLDPEIQGDILDPHFQRGFGISYSHFCEILTHVIDDPATLPTRYPIPFCRLKTLLAEIVKYGISMALAERIVSGLTLRRSDMISEGRQMWEVKQHHRALRRPLFEFPHRLGTHLVWSKGMAKESFLLLLKGATFQKIPLEWQIPEVKQGLDELSNRTGKWFEDLCKENLNRLGLGGHGYKIRIRTIGGSLQIPTEVGEIDFLTGNQKQNLLVLAEFKMVDFTTEPRFYRDDVSQFVTKTNSFMKRFRRKIEWVWDNRKPFSQKFGLNENEIRLATVLLTMYPTFATTFINDFPCVSLTEFMLDYQEHDRWPYKIGFRAA